MKQWKLRHLPIGHLIVMIAPRCVANDRVDRTYQAASKAPCLSDFITRAAIHWIDRA